MTIKDFITQERLKEILNYDPETGIFTNLIKRGGLKAGITPGYTHSSGYILIRADRIQYKAHRLAFLYMTGKFPKDQIDHINHVRNDNRWSNLRESSNKENCKNQTLPRHNSSGALGVCWYKKRKKWVVRIFVDGVSIYLGAFTNKKEAIEKRRMGNIFYGFHPNHGQSSLLKEPQN